MKLSAGIEQYVIGKRARGYLFERGESSLVGFSRHVGDVELDQVKAQQVMTYLDGTITSIITWRLKYYVLLRFFGFWCSRGTMPPLLMPAPRSKVRQAFVPYVYTRPELRALLKATAQNQKPIRSIDRQTLRTIILVLYGTGALVSEVLNLKHVDLDLGKGLMTMRSRSSGRSRELPIGTDLQDVLQRYMVWRCRKRFQSAYLFASKDDHPIPNRSLHNNFQRLRQFAGVLRHDGGTYQPRMHDLRYTFAVHRITSWIRNGADLNRMLPALAAYMGQVGLGSTERYLAMAPERFRKELDKLSPSRRQGHWKDDKDLIEFLGSL